MENYTKEEYINKFGDDAFKSKVLPALDREDEKIESIYATANGNIFMIMKSEEF